MKQIWNVIKYLFLFGLNLLMLFFLHSYFNLMVAIFMIILPIASIGYTYFALKYMELSFSGAKEAMQIEDSFVIKILLNNPTIFPLLNVYVSLKTKNEFFHLEGQHILNVPSYAKSEHEITYPIQSEFLGILEISADELRVADWLGFVVLKRTIDVKKELVLLPSSLIPVEPDMTAVLGGMTELEESRRKGHDFSEVQDVREYIPGDKLNHIHWKLSAKRDVLMVKERVSMSSSQLLILVELYQDEAMILNRILTAAYGVAEALLRAQVPFAFKWWSEKEQDMKTFYVEHRADLDAWMEAIYYEHFYNQTDLGCQVMKRIVNADSSFMVIGSAATGNGTVVLQYGGDVEGYICN